MSYVLIDKPRPDTSLITLNRPDRRNAMAFDVMVPFLNAIQQVSQDSATRVIILTGAGPAFCAGADLEDAGTSAIPGLDGLTRPTIARRCMQLLDDVVLAFRRAPQVVIAAVNGPAIGGGFCLSLAADVRIAAEPACFRAAGINNGLTAAELGLSYLLPRAIGASRAFEIMLSGRDVDAAEAARIGLVSRTTEMDALLPECLQLAGQITGYSRVGTELTKRLLWSSLDASSLQAHMEHEGTAQLYTRLTTQNFEEAVLARRERRAPDFRD